MSAALGIAGQALPIARAANGGIRSLPRVAFAGDSFYDFGKNIGAAPLQLQWTNFSVVNWLRWRFGDRMHTDLSLSFAAGGTRTDHLLNVQLPKILAAGVDLVLVNDGTNNISGQAGAAASMVSDMKAFLAQTSAAGIGVIWNTVIPQNTWSTTLFRQAVEFNQQLARAAANPANRLWIADTYGAMVDFATGYCAAGLLVGDGVHPAIAGGLVEEGVIAPILDRILPPAVSVRVYNTSDYFDAAESPAGNIIKGGLMTGTAGTAVLGATGTIATYWTGGFAASGGSTMTAAFSKGTADGYTNLPTQVITLGGTADGNGVTLEASDLNGNLLVVPAGINAGDTVQATWRVSWAGLVNIKQITAEVRVKDGSGNQYIFVDGAGGVINSQYALGALPAARTGAIMRPPPLTLPAGFNLLRTRLAISALTAGQPIAGTITVQQVALRRQ